TTPKLCTNSHQVTESNPLIRPDNLASGHARFQHDWKCLMNPSAYNAFSDGDSNQPAASGTYGKSLASSLSPMQARLSETRFGWSLQLSPIRAFDALRIWTHLAADVTMADGEEPLALLFDVELAKRSSSEQRDRRIEQATGSLAAIADRLSIETV